MDPLSISSGIAGLLSLAVSIAQVSFEYMSCVEDAPRTIKGLIKEITCLEEVLKGIRNELLLEPEIAQLRAQGMEDRWSGRDALLQECQKDLDALLQELKDKVKGKKVKLLDRASWYFKEDVMKDRIGMLCRYRDQFTALASQDILAIGTLTLKEVRDWRQEESNQKILRWLSPLDFAARHQDISSKRQPETLRWLLASPEYRTWSRSDIPGLIDNRVMWCYGNPGAGKTYASSRVLDHLLETPGMNKPGMAYVYCDYDDQNNQTLSNILGSILKQLIMQSATLPGFIDEIYRKDNHKPTNLEPEIFWKLLERLSKNFPRIYIILDALDELENDKLRTRRNLVRMISMSQAFENNVRIFATSRTHLEDINSALCVFPKLLIEARDSDMRSFLLQRIEGSEDLEDIIHNDEDFKAQIIKALIDKSNKLFLIPALHIDRLLESTSRAEIEETLENITGTIGDAYASTLSRIQNLPRARKELALDTLMWLSHSKRPLRFAELQEALAVRIGSKNINHKAYVSAKVVVNTCLGLIIIERESEIVRLMHPTLEEYLESSQDLFDDPIVKISRILLTYLRFPEPRKWLDDGCDRRYNLHTDGLEYFFNPEAVFPGKPIHIAARFFTTTAIKFLGQCGADCNIKIGGSSPGDRPRRNPLEIMIKSGNVRELTDLSALEALLQAGSDARGSFDNKPLSTPLHMALSIVPFNEPLCELLAFHGAPISAVNGVGETPLRFWATRDTTSSWPPPPIDRDWLIGRWLKRHGASLSELEGAGCLRGKIPTVPCICRILMRVLVCPEDDKDKVLEAFHESRRRETEWHENPVFFFDWSNLYCHSLLLDWLK
ncbi:hypothetical protein MMC11_006600 [Xylographa trunciseda]|nr:hypothetical protein [Xylographa trunciseda]